MTNEHDIEKAAATTTTTTTTVAATLPTTPTPTPTPSTPTSATNSTTTTMTNADVTDTTTTTTTTAATTVLASSAAAAPTATTTTAKTATNGGGSENNGNAQQQQQQQQLNVEQQQVQTSAITTMTMQGNKGKMDNDPSLINFKVLYVLTQLCGLTLIVLVGSWIGQHLGGLGGSDNPSLEFNWHPLFMTIGLIFLYGNSILIYRGFRTVRKKTLKLTHAGIHMGAFILTVIALKTVFDSHNFANPPIPNMYSLHSWLGLSAVIIFCLQYVAGFMAYLVPGLKESYKIAMMPFHIYFGLFGFVLAIASALMGITEKAIFKYGNTYSTLPAGAVLANVIGVLYVVFGGLVVFLVTETSYKRKALPEDTALLTSNQE